MKIIYKPKNTNLMRLFALLYCVIITYFFHDVIAQDVIRCGTVEYNQELRLQHPRLQSDDDFEVWLAEKIEEQKELETKGLIVGGVYTIPVVVHVIHSGEPVGSGSNISYAAIVSQIDVLNEDFRRKVGTNGYNTHPDGADVEIEFCLAQRRPNGTAFPNGENGVNRINRNTAGFSSPPYTTTYIDNTIKPYSTVTQGYSANNYMNFWSLNLTGSLLGYAQFPLTILGGLDCNASPANSDGVVMNYYTIGKASVTGQPAPYNQGRTSTHEIGHWLGLRHIWGDNPNCNQDDFCADTPPATTSSSGCNLNKSSCGSLDMVRNYMDYSDDACMNIFTNDQRRRMRTVLENSPRRRSLLFSDACIPPVANDASIVNIISPEEENCAGSITPIVTLKNRGTNNLTSAIIEYTIDGVTPTAFNWTGSLAPGNQINVTLPTFTVPLGVHVFRAVSLLPNGTTDQYTNYDASEIEFFVSKGIETHHIDGFEEAQFPPQRWKIDNTNNDCYTWVAANATSSGGTVTNTCAMMNNYNNNSYKDEYLYTPLFSLPCNATLVELMFDVAYRRYDNSSNDRLRVEISTDCGATWQSTPVYDKSGASLRTVTSNSTSDWYPTNANQWRTETIDLTPFVGSSTKTVRFRFRATNDYGNNLFIDNVEFEVTSPANIKVVDEDIEDVLNGGSFDFGQHAIGTPITKTFTIYNFGQSNLILTPPISITGSSDFVVSSSFGNTTIPMNGSTAFSITFTPSSATNVVANISFANNVCGESPYTMQLMGSGIGSPPTANFSVDNNTICQNNSVTFSDLSTLATSWLWTFNGGSPSNATTAGPHTVSYSTPGTYTVTLNVTNSDGTDTHTETNYITVLSSAGQSLPLFEGFVNTSFPPTGWTITNGGDPRTWGRTTLNGNAPTAGNAMGMDFYSSPDTSGDIDDITLTGVDLSGYASAILTFDVAYAQYSTYSDELNVLVSPGCGQAKNVEYAKSGNSLATEPPMSVPYLSVSTWRKDTVNLSAYIGNTNVEITFRGISGYGNILYIDNINIVGTNITAVADFSISKSSACVGETVVYTDNSTGATSWNWNFGANASPSTANGQGPHSVSYSNPGTKNITLTIDGGVNTTKNIQLNPIPTAPSVSVVDNCGSSILTAVGSNLVWSTGATTASITVTSSGSYSVTQTVGGCTSVPATITANPVTSTPAPSVSVVDNCGSSILTAVGSNLVWSTGETTASITVTNTGVFYVSQTQNGCVSATASITANPLAIPTVILNSFPEICVGDSSLVLFTGTPVGGIYLGVGVQNGVFNPQGTGIGNHNISYQYTDVNGCSAVAQRSITVKDCNNNALGIDEEMIVFEIFPIPTFEYIEIHSSDRISTVRIFDSSSRLIYEQSSLNSYIEFIDLSNFASGIYHVVTTTDKTVQTNKIIKE